MCNLYVLEPDTVARRALSRALPEHTLHFFDTSQELTRALTQTQYPVNAVLCDLNHEREHRFSLARQWKHENASIPLIWLTPRLPWQELKEVLDKGGNDYIFKPFLPGMVQQFVQRSLCPLSQAG